MNHLSSYTFVTTLCLMIVTGCGSKPGPDLPRRPEGYFQSERTVVFPDLGSGTWVRLRERDSKEILDWDTVSRAEGEVVVPPMFDLMVSFRPDEKPQIKNLRKISPTYGVQVIDLFSTRVRNRDLKVLAFFPELEALALNSTEIGDRGLAHVRHTPGLKYLGIKGTEVTDAGLTVLEGLPELSSLRLGYNDVTDAGLAHLQHVRKLKHLWLSYCPVGDATLEHIGRLHRLESLVLSGTQVTNAGISHLAGLSRLEVLYLQNTDVDDACLVHLAELHELETLDLRGTNVTGPGLAHLGGLAQLENLCLNSLVLDADVACGALEKMEGLLKLDLRGTDLRDKHVERIYAALPEIEIQVDQD